MQHYRPPLYRRLIAWVMAATYLLVTCIAAYYVFQIRDNLRAQVVDSLESTLQDQVAAWEDEIERTLDEWIDLTVSTPVRAALRQAQMRKREPWFNALYVWERTLEPTMPGKGLPPPRIMFPLEPVLEHPSVMARMCLARARFMSADPMRTPQERASMFTLGCQRESLPVRLVAASEAATILSGYGQYEAALAALDAAHMSENATLAGAAAENIPPFRVAVHLTQRATNLLQLGRTDEALDLMLRVGLEITALDAPDAKHLVQHVRWPIQAQLRRHDRHDDAARLDAQLAMAERRIAALAEIRDRILGRPIPPGTSEPPRFIYDQYSKAPFLLYYGWRTAGDYGVALQLEQAVLLHDFLTVRSLSRMRRYLTVSDTSGDWVAGARRGGDVALSVPFARTLKHLRVGVRDEMIQSRLARVQDQWLTPLLVICACAMMGIVALWFQVRAIRQQTSLLARQREFTTRVTHELKTPIAGIRIMAENLEAGAWKDDAHLRDMARRIVEETDRLTDRVDEVLAVARDRKLPDPVPFDPEEPVLVAIDQWGPRLEDAGVRLHADLHPTDEVRGDARAIRDAVSCLLDNALKYRRDAVHSEVWLELSQQGPWVLIAVADNGIGVPADKRAQIFERFVRVEGPNRGKSGGHGLGLSQVADIARAHGGEVLCTDGIDGGARFVMRLQAHRA